MDSHKTLYLKIKIQKLLLNLNFSLLLFKNHFCFVFKHFHIKVTSDNKAEKNKPLPTKEEQNHKGKKMVTTEKLDLKREKLVIG